MSIAVAPLLPGVVSDVSPGPTVASLEHQFQLYGYLTSYTLAITQNNDIPEGFDELIVLAPARQYKIRPFVGACAGQIYKYRFLNAVLGSSNFICSGIIIKYSE